MMIDCEIMHLIVMKRFLQLNYFVDDVELNVILCSVGILLVARWLG